MEKLEVLTKEKILEATEETLKRFGLTKTSVTDVANALDVSHGSIYRHFKSKAELFEGATEKWLDEKIIKPLTDVCKDSSMVGTQHLKTYIKTLIELKRCYAREDEELFKMYAKVTEESADLIHNHVSQITDQMSEIICRSSINVDDPHQLARTIFQATTRFHHPAHAYEWKSPTINSEFSNVWALIENGLS
ncbi:TetR/AcrR family transcriptional regulator [Desulfosporosinus lacus]|uniref:Transcriptional regulator, TetR family n=1 Tax=Desulfosporosinus lacus DSM 15449 TaxID=1121420 RepID=A0A1M5XDE4_9FIRM|nr:TetR family transcriptional regulator [Desulfosporosinus lacus]SHH97672.1 transcriptional regulator, TetR family [Desulfosporosinus lacus DSM 15449]